MRKGYLIDSKAIIDFFNGSLSDDGKNFLSNSTPAISIITLIEIFSSKKALPGEIIQLQKFSEITITYNLDRNLALLTINLRKRFNIKLLEAIIVNSLVFQTYINNKKRF